MLLFAAILAFYLAFNLGANDVANSMGTSVGAKSLRLGQAIVLAGVLEFLGAVLLGQRVSLRLVNDIVPLHSGLGEGLGPQVWLLAMLAVLVATGVWLNVATVAGLPVSSSHAVVGAIAGVGWVAAGPQAVNWGAIGQISLAWVVTPGVSGAIAALLVWLLTQGIERREDPQAAFTEWVPWISLGLFAVFGSLTFPALAALPLLAFLGLTPQLVALGLGAIGSVALAIVIWHAPSSLPFARFQVTSAAFVAFAHGANDVGNAVAPLGAIAQILATGGMPGEAMALPLWILLLGGGGIVAGLAVLGKGVMMTVGDKIVPLQPSTGFCAELATAITVLSASQLGLPVSTSHAIVGAVVGIGLAQRQAIQWATVRSIGLTWVVTIPAATGIAAIVFAGLRRVAM